MPKKTIILIIFLALLTLFFLNLASIINNNPAKQNEQITPSIPKTNKSAQLYFNPQTILVKPYTIANASSAIFINAQKNTVSAVQIEISFDPEIISVSDISIPFDKSFFGTSRDFNILIKDIDNKNGRISYGAKMIGESTKKGTGKLLEIYFNTKPTKIATESTEIKFLEKTVVIDPKANESVLARASSLFVQFNSSNSAIIQPYNQPSNNTKPSASSSSK
ncbi:MAG: hypothetical protein A2857_04475 [Candidatus Levybacteria bacterium RIFCSPHIGHO2_01_FULL_36_15]|nr:MAG: hypothetical protein A2857_04475 [Candidatus Levybacteria bacterium RIFCSPHIGHO2_01_FULL_36_15]OGH38611.1 MAG: hypothetical protein A2905_03230 [Candidatus Levybacteria bacterium RIFCSPLOWO2_01_FULL_36_10]